MGALKKKNDNTISLWMLKLEELHGRFPLRNVHPPPFLSSQRECFRLYTSLTPPFVSSQTVLLRGMPVLETQREVDRALKKNDNTILWWMLKSEEMQGRLPLMNVHPLPFVSSLVELKSYHSLETSYFIPLPLCRRKRSKKVINL